MENNNINTNSELNKSVETISDTNNLENNSKPLETEKTFTQEEVNQIIAKRLLRERKDIEEKIEKERKEAQELAKLSETEKQQKLFEKRLAEFEETKKAFEREKLLNETQTQLSLRSLPIAMAKYIIGETAEITLENINEFEREFNTELEKKVNERLKGNTLKTGTIKVTNGQVTKEDFLKMNYSQRMKLFNENNELYQELIK